MAAFAVLVAAACADLATRPERIPTALRVGQDVVTTTVGESLSLSVAVLDQAGESMEVPNWAAVRWSVAASEILTPMSNGVRAESPGASIATAKVAGLEKAITVRVNPRQLKLNIAHVAVSQVDNPGPQLDPDRAARVDVFLTGDEVNFFRPKVRLRVQPSTGSASVFETQRTDESVPRTFDVTRPQGAWSITIPAALIRPGVAITVEADPEASVPRAPGTVDRFPASGSHALDVKRRTLGVTVRGAHLTQSVQSFAGSVPLVAGRDALLRVFLTADEQSDLEAAVKAYLHVGGVVVRQVTLRRSGSIPLSVDESRLETSWNAAIPGSWLVSGLSMTVEVDPEGRFAFTPSSQPRYPASGTLPLNVREVPRLWLRMIPIHQVSVGIAGSIHPGNIGDYLAAATTKFPVATVDADIRATYFTTARASTDAGWQQILREIEALRTADGSRRYYYGVLRHPGGSSIGGLGYVGWPAAIGYDQMPAAAETFAHELGHNFSLRHAPCGGPSGPDLAFPYTGGGIGVYGFDVRSGTLKSPAVYKDLMSYCSPEWISDYSYTKTLSFRDRWDWTSTGPDQAAAREDAVLIWGGVEAGRLVLEPAFALEMVERLPDGAGAYRIQGFDEGGEELFSYRFNPSPVDHRASASNFAFAIPADIAQPERLSQLRLSGPEGEVLRSRHRAMAPAARVSSSRSSAGIALAWERDYPMALLRDRVTGQILSFARGGQVSIPDRTVDVLLSDGVLSSPAPIQTP